MTLQRSKDGRSIRLWAAGFIVLGSFLRIWNFWKPELWLDEYATWWVAQSAWKEVFARSVSVVSAAPLYNVLVKLSLGLFGQNPFALRLPSVFAGTAVLILSFPLALAIFRSQRTALYSVAVFSVHPLLIWYSQEARPYTFGILFVMVSFLAYLHLMEDVRQVRWRFVHLAGSVAAFYMHYLFGLAVVVQMAHAYQQGAWKKNKAWSGIFGRPFLLASAGSIHILHLFRWRKTYAYLSSQSSLKDVLGISAQLFGLSFLVTVAVILILRIVFRQKEKAVGPFLRNGQLLLLWIAMPTAGLFIIPQLFGVNLLAAEAGISLHRYLFFIDDKTVHATRYLAVVFPAASLLLAGLIAQTSSRPSRQCLPMAAYLLFTAGWFLVPNLLRAPVFSAWPLGGYRQAAQRLSSRIAPGDLVLFSPGYTDADLVADADDPFAAMRREYLLWPLIAHLPEKGISHLRILPSRDNAQTKAYMVQAEQEASGYSRVWIIGSSHVLAPLKRSLSKQAGFVSKQEERYGLVNLTLLEFDRKAGG